jgi:hypothetical protein
MGDESILVLPKKILITRIDTCGQPTPPEEGQLDMLTSSLKQDVGQYQWNTCSNHSADGVALTDYFNYKGSTLTCVLLHRVHNHLICQ